jgi:sucrose-phosphate synthase
MLSVHGLIRSENPELGVDADTGGQVQYVLDLARALGQHESVDRVTLVTRQIFDATVASDYALAREIINNKAELVRLPFGPRRYVRKELLWPHLDQLVDQCLQWMRQLPSLPDVIHAHYADAAYVGEQLSLLLDIPLIVTAHSLGRQKRSRLMESGRKEQTVDKQFNFARRIRAEEKALEHASLVVASTRQELTTQYSDYENFVARRSVVIPPGVDLQRFKPSRSWPVLKPGTYDLFEKFLHSPRKPVILALCRPDTRKNIGSLVRAYGMSDQLQSIANMVIVAGSRDDIRTTEEEARTFYTDLLLDIDLFDLFGRVAIPKHHLPEQIPEIYRYVARTRGVLVNPSLNENFGLTLIEAAASGLPVIATDQGGPTEIIANCRHGVLIDPLDVEQLSRELLDALTDKNRWRRWAANGLKNAPRFYSWEAHAGIYVRHVSKMLQRHAKTTRNSRARAQGRVVTSTKLARTKFLLVTDLDHTLIGSPSELRLFIDWLREHANDVAFGVATGRTVESTIALLRANNVPQPNVIVGAVGTDIRYGSRLVADNGWQDHVRYFWRRNDLVSALSDVPMLRMQLPGHQTEFKISYDIVSGPENVFEHVSDILKRYKLRANLVTSHGRHFDVVPVRASKGRAIRHLAYKWGLQLSDVLVAGDSGNDFDMLSGETLGVVVGNYASELEVLRNRERIYFASSSYAGGIREGIAHYKFAVPFSEHDAIRVVSNGAGGDIDEGFLLPADGTTG